MFARARIDARTHARTDGRTENIQPPAESLGWKREGTTTATRYDTIRDAILTCARKPTRVSLIYRTEPTSKKWKQKKLNSKKG